jgi:hypothetical protein
MSTAIIQGATGGKFTIPTIPHFKDHALTFDLRITSVLADRRNTASTLDMVAINQVWDYLWSNSYWKRLS